MLKDPGYLKVTGMGGQKKEAQLTEEQIHAISSLKKGMPLPVKDYTIKDGTTSAPKRYNSGSLILAMENAGQLIEDEDLREQIKGSGIGTSATRAEISAAFETFAFKHSTKTNIVIDNINFFIRFSSLKLFDCMKFRSNCHSLLHSFPTVINLYLFIVFNKWLFPIVIAFYFM